jgi:hypothetical protein
MFFLLNERAWALYLDQQSVNIFHTLYSAERQNPSHTLIELNTKLPNLQS